MFVEFVDIHQRKILLNATQIVAVVPGKDENQALIYTTGTEINPVGIKGNYNELVSSVMDAAKRA